MTQKKYMAVTVALVFVTTLMAQAQEIKDGLCPGSNSNSHYSALGSGDKISGNDEFNQLAGRSQFAMPQYSPVLLNANTFGVGAVGTFSVSDKYIIRASIISLSSSTPFGLAGQNLGGILLPLQFGLRIPIVHSILGTMDYTLYGETAAGLLLAAAMPTNGSFLTNSIPNSRFASGASTYLGIGNTLRFDKYVGLYLNGGAEYFDLFSSSFMPRTNYFYPSVSVGFLFNLAP